MLSQEILLKRLALIKYLYRMGINQSRLAEPIGSFSILSLHDSIEMFLKLLAEHLNINSEKFSFHDYWIKIPNLTLKESMRNLNSRRVNIKHKGLLPSKTDIEISRVNATDFFEQNTSIHFGFDFKKISLFSLIQYDNIRNYLEYAQKYLEENKIEDCIKTTAIAFDELVSTYEKSKSSYYSNSPFSFGKDLSHHNSFFMGIGRDLGNSKDRKLGQFIDKVKDSMEEIQRAVKIMSFGIDYKRFVKFKVLTPIIFRTADGKHIAEIREKKKWSNENCQYCIDFVLESSLIFQDFEFDLDELIEMKV